MKISKERVRQIIKEELELAENDAKMPYSGPKSESRVDDLEGELVKDQLCHIAQYAIAMAGMLEDDQELEGWVQSKITLAKDYVSKVKHHLENELHVDIPTPSKEEIYDLINKEEETNEEQKTSNYAGKGSFYYEV